MQIKIKRIENGKLPEYKTIGSAGADCYARLEKDVVIKAGKNAIIPLGFAVEIPSGYEMQIRGRSGLACKNEIEGFTGTIDSDYRGEVNAIIFNHSDEDFTVKNNDRIAQAIVSPVIKAKWNEVNKLSETERGTNGFGSTGISYNHGINKFYEPFETLEQAEMALGRTVKIDNKINAFVFNVSMKKTVVGDKVHFIFKNAETFEQYGMFAPLAYERVTIDGHRFGKEMEFNEKLHLLKKLHQR